MFVKVIDPVFLVQFKLQTHGVSMESTAKMICYKGQSLQSSKYGHKHNTISIISNASSSIYSNSSLLIL